MEAYEEVEPETLSLWHKMIEALKSHIKYSHSVKKTVSDIKVTDIFCELGEDAGEFWGQLLKEKNLKTNMETLLGCTFKKGGGKVRVQQIPLSRDTEITQGFIDFVANRIRSTERLWTCTAVKGLNETLVSPEVSRMEIIDIPNTPTVSTSSELKIVTELEHTRSYSQRQMQGSVLKKSATTLRRVKQKACEVLQEAFNCDKSQAFEIAQVVCTPHMRELRSHKHEPSTSVSSSSSQISPDSQLRPQCLEKVMKQNTTFTDDEKFAVVESFADCKTREEKEVGLNHLKSIMAPKDSRYNTIDYPKLTRWIKKHERVKNGKVDEKRGKKVIVEFENDIWAELLLCAIQMKEDEEGKIEESVEVLFNVCYSYSIIRQAAEDVARSEKWENNPRVQILQFSNKWITGFLHRRDFARRKITRQKKDVPDEKTIHEKMKKYQDELIRGGYAIIQIGNMDETAINWGIGPTHVYCGKDAERGEQEITDIKARITGIPLVIADGKLAPTMFIIKHSVSSAARADQTGMRVIPNLHKSVGFTVDDGWDMLTWERKMTVSGEKRAEESEDDEVADAETDSTNKKRKKKGKNKKKKRIRQVKKILPQQKIMRWMMNQKMGNKFIKSGT